jgi:hypothetical protein
MKKEKQFLTKKKIVAIIILILVTFCILGCKKKDPSLLPPPLIGIWLTDNSLYKERYIEIYDNQIIFGTGEDKSQTFFVDKVKKYIIGATTEWVFYCEDMEGNPFEVVIFYKGETDANPNSGSIKLKNQATIIWHRAVE